MPYYGVYVPVKGGAGVATVLSHISTACNNPPSSTALDRDTAKSSYVFREKTDALQILKQHKDSRLKEFHNEDDAVKYAQTGYEVVQTKYKDSKAPNTSLEKAAFRAPTKKERIDFRNAIESGNYERVKTMIWDNPRYLVSSGDTPTTLKEGCRYNAMHLCAVHRRPNVAELILKTVSDTKFADLLTGKKNDQKMCQELCANLLDYYLNMPEKVLNETPLHLAAKWGCVPMVEVLISYAECKMTRNNMNLLPEQIICSRDVGSEPFAHRTIKMLLKERFYVPVLRCNDDSVPPQIGQPFSSNSPPNLTCDHLSPEVEIKALAGPMSKTEAEQFFRRWKTPPRLGSNLSSPVVNKLFISPMKPLPPASSTPHKTPILNKLNFSTPTATLQRRALFKSTEVETLNEFATSIDNAFNVEPHGNSKRIGISLLSNDQLKSESNNNNEATTATLCPGTPLFKIKKDAFFTYRDTNVASPLINRFDVNIDNEFGLMNTSGIYDTPFIERHIKNSDPEKGLECIGRELAREQSVEWREYWDFLEEFVDIAAPKGLEKLENYLAQHHREIYNQNQRTANASVIFDNVCSALEKFGFSPALQKTGHNGEIVQDENGLRRDLSHSDINVSLAHQLSTPYTYVEKSLQVHAKRMTKTIIHNIDNLTSINDSLVLELRRVKSLIYSFKEDVSFLNVCFEKVHSRIGNLVSIFLNNSQEITFLIKPKILNIIQNLILAPGERREHMECVLSRIRDMLEHSVQQILPENLKTEEICSKIWLEERNCNCGWESNLNRKTSRRNRMEARFKNHQRFKQHENSFKQSHLVKLKATSNNSNGVCRTPCSSNDSSEDEEVHWTDAYSEVESTDSDGNEVWLTPPDSPSRISLRDDNSHFEQQVYICGNEPTKRDLDVLNAIFHIEIDNVKYPNIHSWKSALMHYPNEELDYFPSPRVNKKSYSFMLNKSDSTLQIPLNQQGHSQSLRDLLNSSSNLFKTCNEMVKDQMKKQPNITNPASKNLPAISVPSLPKTVNDSKSENTTSTLPNVAELKKQHQRPLTPINKLHGLFSSYREPLNVSSTSFNSPSNLSNASSNFNQNI